MQDLGKTLCYLGLILFSVGLVLWKFDGKLPLGRLPGDLSIQREGFSFYFPFATCILISLLLTFLASIFRR